MRVRWASFPPRPTSPIDPVTPIQEKVMPTPKPPTPADDGLVTHVHSETPSQVAEYWTPDRMRDAQPVPMPVIIVPPMCEVKPPPAGEGGKKPTDYC